jgi:bleomycin hydrolase
MKVHAMPVATALVALCVMLAAPCAFAQKSAGLTPEVLAQLEASFKLDERTRALMNAVSNNDAKSLALNRELYNGHDDVFNCKVDVKGITDQAMSGRCWLFAGLNIMRPAVMKKYNLEDFEFSQSHLFFWDKLEKANFFLEAAIETRDRSLDDRELQVLTKDPIPDGGWWSFVVDLIEKYGVVPKGVMPETNYTKNTGMMNSLLAKLMRRDAAELRAMAAKGSKVPALEARKVEMLKDVYRLLVMNFGLPPQSFTWRYEDKDKKVHEATFTPQSFYKDAVGVDLRDYVAIFDHPAKPYGKHYSLKYDRDMADAPDMDFINMKIQDVKPFVLKALFAGEPVWFAADAGAENDKKDGIFALGMYDYRSLLGVNLDLSKADRVLYFESSPNHAMVFVGADTLGGGGVRQWRVENSWGTDVGVKGYWTMYDDWFDQYVYGVILEKAYVPADVLAILSTKAEVLPAWDPMREMFR